MTMLFFLKPHYSPDGGRKKRTIWIEDVEETPVKRRRKKSYRVEPAKRTVLAREDVESLLTDVEQKRRARRRRNLEILLKFMLGD